MDFSHCQTLCESDCGGPIKIESDPSMKIVNDYNFAFHPFEPKISILSLEKNLYNLKYCNLSRKRKRFSK
jgi:hypothetical protein